MRNERDGIRNSRLCVAVNNVYNVGLAKLCVKRHDRDAIARQLRVCFTGEAAIFLILRVAGKAMVKRRGGKFTTVQWHSQSTLHEQHDLMIDRHRSLNMREVHCSLARDHSARSLVEVEPRTRRVFVSHLKIYT